MKIGGEKMTDFLDKRTVYWIPKHKFIEDMSKTELLECFLLLYTQSKKREVELIEQRDFFATR